MFAEYVTLLADTDKESMVSIVGNYVYSKHYGDVYADLSPLVMSDALYEDWTS